MHNHFPLQSSFILPKSAPTQTSRGYAMVSVLVWAAAVWELVRWTILSCRIITCVCNGQAGYSESADKAVDELEMHFGLTVVRLQAFGWSETTRRCERCWKNCSLVWISEVCWVCLFPYFHVNFFLIIHDYRFTSFVSILRYPTFAGSMSKVLRWYREQCLEAAVYFALRKALTSAHTESILNYKFVSCTAVNSVSTKAGRGQYVG
jgi:hypothetical protein